MKRFALCLLVVLFADASPAAACLVGCWRYSLEARASDCSDVAVGQTKTGKMQLRKCHDDYELTPYQKVGNTTHYAGWEIRHGFTVSLYANCPAGANPICSNNSETITAERDTPHYGGKLSPDWTVVWVEVRRNSSNAYSCRVVYTGTAKLSRNCLRSIK